MVGTQGSRLARDHTTQQWQSLGDHCDSATLEREERGFFSKYLSMYLSLLTWGMCSGLATTAHIPRETLFVALVTSGLPHSQSFLCSLNKPGFILLYGLCGSDFRPRLGNFFYKGYLVFMLSFVGHMLLVAMTQFLLWKCKISYR